MAWSTGHFTYFFISSSVMSGRWVSDNDGLYATEPFTIENIPTSSGARSRDRYTPFIDSETVLLAALPLIT